MKQQTASVEALTGRSLDQSVWKAEGGSADAKPPPYSSNPLEAHPIIEREKITSMYHDNISEETGQ
ncbi:hypothetical protein BURKHO8Y_520158 [Burkholderia sp. 8Y]|uniref:hypothetical protein n=1 Tax=Burkholderia sp. 8Y TaxID=2653133 RepID=UPI0012F3C762|nr:hypothetical protein [Burkholderia sp. 8Y]VXC89207.1 hypothetical protein BURKHO8Y_520158 [Burkholderia sp. 8Y]